MAFKDTEQFFKILQCPNCGAELSSLRATPSDCICKQRYALNGTSVVFFSSTLPEKYDVPEYTSSNPYTWDALDLIEQSKDGLILDLGAGQPDVDFPNVVQLEIRKYRGTDVVIAEGRLPFKDASIDGVISLSVLEHVQDPARYVSEISRILKPGGRCVLHSAFMQPLHGAPYHFFNTSHYALAHLFRDFEISSIKPGPHQHPWITLRWILESYLAGLTNNDRESIRNLTVGELGQLLRRMTDARTEVKKDTDPFRRADNLLYFNERHAEELGALIRLAPSTVTELAAGFMVDARKSQ